MRLPPLPQLDWSDPAGPRSLDAGDVYFSGDGLAEKRAVFLGGCGLPEGWAGRERFCIGELGFGAGVSFLATWEAWRLARPTPTARLEFLSFEGALMSAEDAARVHAAWPEIAELSARLVARWPVRARGVQRIALGDGVALTLFVDDIAAALPETEARVDAWYLDGFAPSKNAEMWGGEVLAHVARMCAPGARAATYTVAGDVRRGLEAAGFAVSKVPNIGRKKERLEAKFGGEAPSPLNRSAASPRVLVIGAGVAGASVARAFHQRGAKVTVLDAGAQLGAGASGNAVALVMPRLDAEDGPIARAGIAAWLAARRVWGELGQDATREVGVKHLAKADAERRRFAKLVADPPVEARLLRALDEAAPEDGLMLSSFAVRPEVALARMLDGVEVRFGASVARIEETEDQIVAHFASGESIVADMVVVCAGMGATRIDGVETPRLEGRLGQMEWTAGDAGPEAASDGGYVVAAFGCVAFGATFEAAPEGEPRITDAARAHNLGMLRRLRPDLADAVESSGAPGLTSRAAVRATTQDRLPFAGLAEHPASAPTNAKAPDGTPAPSRRIRLLGGLGSRGFLWAPLLAELLAAEAFGDPVPLGASARKVFDPARFAERARRRSGGH
jgi:tRNA 5-methylaminomethyl-2-thiouridine biosynthesis bifunctional protein